MSSSLKIKVWGLLRVQRSLTRVERTEKHQGSDGSRGKGHEDGRQAALSMCTHGASTGHSVMCGRVRPEDRQADARYVSQEDSTGK